MSPRKATFRVLAGIVSAALLGSGLVLPATAHAETADLVVSKAASDEFVAPDSSVGYTIEVTNTTDLELTVATVTDDLPDGFTYDQGSTQGATTADPSDTAGVLEWTVDATVAAGDSLYVSFGATVPLTEGTYLNSASATSAATVLASGPTAEVTVGYEPMTLTASPRDGAVNLSWFSPRPEVTDYRVFYQPGATAPGLGQGTEVTVSDDASEVEVTGLTNGTEYSFSVFALNDSDSVVDEATASATPALTPVTDLQAAGAGTGKVVLTWVNPPGVTDVVVRYSSVEAPATPTDGTGVAVPSGAETVTISGLTNGTTYYFSVFASRDGQHSEPASAELTPFGCPDLSAALDAPTGLVTGSSWVACAGAAANRNDSTLDTALPRTGTQALMTSGDVGVADPPSDGGGEGEGLSTGSRGAHDVSIYKLDLAVPTGTSCLYFDYAFASEEYPEFVGQAFNDGFLAELDVNDWSVDDSIITAPHNFARTSDGDYVSVNSPVFADPTKVLSAEESGTGYDGFSQPLRASTPITPGAHSLYLSIFDAGDDILDSAAFIDRLALSSSACSAGTSVIPPNAVDDEDDTEFETPVTTDVLDNDQDPAGGSLTVTANTQGAHGTVTCTSTDCTYTPEDDFSGEDSYTYTITNTGGGTDTATVTVTVGPPAAPNNPPTAVDDESSTPSGTAKQVSVLGNDTDPDNHPLTITADTDGAHGTVTCTSTTCTYTPAGSYRGGDSFTYTISDGHGGTDTATVTMTVTNRAPDAVNDSASTPSGAAKQVSVLVNDTDPEGDSLTVTGKTNGANGTVECSTTSCTYTPTGNYRGSDSFTYTISDGNGGTDTATVTMTITNRVPDAVNDSASTPSGAAKQVSVLVNDTDPEGDSLTVTGKTNGAHGTASCTSTTCTYTPTGSYRGGDSFTYTISDGNTGADTATVTMTVTNRGPDAVDDAVGSVSASGSKTIQVLGNDTDPENDTLSVTDSTDGAKGSVDCSASDCTYTPNGTTGSDSFTYTVSDGNGGTDIATVNLNIVSNQDPLANDDTATTPSGTAKSVSVLANDSDPDGDSLSITAKTNGTNGTVTCTSTTCTYTPAGSYRGSDSFTYTVSDGHGGTDTASVAVTVTNRAPNAVNDNGGSIVAGTSKTINILSNDTDPEGDTLIVTGHTQGAKGSVNCTSSSCTYAAGGTTGADSFTYTISDGHGGTDTATVTVSVAGAAVGSVSIALSDTTLAWPQQVTVTGVLKSKAGNAVPGRSVELWALPDAGSWGRIATVTSSGTGQLTFDHRPVKRTTYQWRVPGTTVQSGNAIATVTPTLTWAPNVSDLPYNRNLRVTGLSSPVTQGANVVLQRKNGASWSNVATSTFATGSTATTGGAAYTLTELITDIGTFSFRVHLPAQHGRAAVTGSAFSVTVYRANVASFVKKAPESLTIKNIGTTTFNTTGWRLRNQAGKQATLPTRNVAPGQTLKILTGSGTSTASAVYLGAGAMFGDVHDDITLSDGSYLVLRHQY